MMSGYNTLTPLFKRFVQIQGDARTMAHAMEEFADITPEARANKINAMTKSMFAHLDPHNQTYAVTVSKLEAFLKEARYCSLMRDEYADLALEIDRILGLANVDLKRYHLQLLLQNSERLKEFFLALSMNVEPKAHIPTSSGEVIENSLDNLTEGWKSAAQQMVYDPEARVVKELVDFFYELFDLYRVASGEEPMFTNKKKTGGPDKVFLPPPPAPAPKPS